MIELTPADVSVILRQASTQGLDYLPTAQLNDDGQTEIVRWIEGVGKLDDQLSPYAWYSLAEEAAATDDPEEPIMIEMLPTYTLSGESEMLELCRMAHFDWSIDVVPVEFIQNTEELLDAGVPVRLLLLAEVASNAFLKRMIDLYPEMEEHEPQLMVSAINAFFMLLCESAGFVPDDTLLSFEDDDMDFRDVNKTQFDEALEECIDDARSAIVSLDAELDTSLPETVDLLDMECFNFF